AAGYYALGALPIIVGVPLGLLFLREAPTQPTGTSPVAGQSNLSGSSLSQALAGRAFWLVGASAFLMAVAINGAQTHLVP
ncbi:hypothetical protein, partial [Bacillus siamensis]|uniref:hypothetical protein n=1 Tax=Bacillus siamensis TaxID=659243 RepID=UPI0039ECFD46